MEEEVLELSGVGRGPYLPGIQPQDGAHDRTRVRPEIRPRSNSMIRCALLAASMASRRLCLACS